MIKVIKFGGSSVASSEQFKKVKNIVDIDNTRRFIVTSACGKENKNDHKVTDLLYLCHAHIKYGVEYQSIFSLIQQKYEKIANDLNLTINLKKEFDEIKTNMSNNMSIDYLVSRGEYLTSLMLAEYLNCEFLDAKDFITFNYDNTIDMKTSKEKFDKLVDKKKKYVFPGFYGVMPNGDIKCMTRGGSDITGAIIANLLDANIYENWTDVSGILVADPKIVKNPKSIPLVSYEELRHLSYMGANVLHEETIFPVKEKNIPINIRNTNDFENNGTIIKSDCTVDDEKNPPSTITSITGKKDYIILHIKKKQSNTEQSLLRKTLQILENYNIKYETIPASVDSFGIVIENKLIEKYLYEIIGKIKEEDACENINVQNNIALIAIIGRGMISKKGISGKIFGTLGENNINIKLINQGSDEINITIGIDNNDYEKAINCIYDNFIK